MGKAVVVETQTGQVRYAIETSPKRRGQEPLCLWVRPTREGALYIQGQYRTTDEERAEFEQRAREVKPGSLDAMLLGSAPEATVMEDIAVINAQHWRSFRVETGERLSED